MIGKCRRVEFLHRRIADSRRLLWLRAGMGHYSRCRAGRLGWADQDIGRGVGRRRRVSAAAQQAEAYQATYG